MKFRVAHLAKPQYSHLRARLDSLNEFERHIVDSSKIHCIVVNLH